MSNTINFVQGTTRSYEVDLVDEHGEPLRRRARKLEGAVATFLLRVQPTDVTNVIEFTSVANPTSISIDFLRDVILLNFQPTDTSGLALGLYFYQIQVSLPTGEIYSVVDWSLFDLNLGGAAATPPAPFPSTVTITADYPLPNDMQYQTPAGCPIVGAQVRVYLKSDYDAGNLNSPVGITTTNPYGKWMNPILVVPGYTYVAQFLKPYEYGPDTFEFFA
jgi:hypothetical protein